MASTDVSEARQAFQVAIDDLRWYFAVREEFDWDCHGVVLRPLRKCPAALLETDDRGWNVLQIACEYKAMTPPRSDLICKLIDWMPDAVQTIKAATSPRLLHDLWSNCGRKQREAFASCLRALLQAAPEYVTILDDDSNTLLHRACSNQAPLDVIQLLLDMWRPAAAARNRKEETPLHVECRLNRRNNDTVVRLLLSACPEAIKQRDCAGRLPLHLALTMSPGFIDLLLELYPQSVVDGDTNGDTSLHLACARCFKVSVVQKLLSVRPQVALTPNVNGLLPIHIATYRAPHLVDLLMQSYPQTLTFTDKDGCTPLHFAAGYDIKDTIATVQRLVGVWPTMAARPDINGISPLYYACNPRINRSRADALSVVYILLRAAPLQLRLR